MRNIGDIFSSNQKHLRGCDWGQVECLCREPFITFRSLFPDIMSGSGRGILRSVNLKNKPSV